MKGWIIRMEWVVLFSASLGFASDSEHSSEIAKHPERNKMGKRRAILQSVLMGKDSKNLADPFPDLFPLYSILADDGTRDYAMGKGCYAKYHRNSLRLLWRYLFNILDEEFSDEEFSDEKYSDEEDSKQKEDSQNEEHSGERSDSLGQEEENSEREEKKFDDKEFLDEEDWRRAKLFPTTKRLRELFTTPQLLRMNIDLERLQEIENLRTLLKPREFTPEEESLLNEAK